MTKVVNCNKEAYDVYIGRACYGHPDRSIWANPFKDGTRKENIVRFREWLPSQNYLMNQLEKLRGQRLGCHCKPQDCHGDFYVELLKGI